MAWTTPPTFAAGVLSAAQLNILSDDLEYLYGVLQASIQPFRVLTLNLQYSNNLWYIRYKLRYLHYRVKVTGVTHDALSLVVNGTTVFSDGVQRSTNYIYAGYVDLNAQGLTPGQLYAVQFSNTFPTYNSGISVEWLRLSGSTTL